MTITGKKHLSYSFIFHRIYHIDCHEILLYKPMKSMNPHENSLDPHEKNTILGQVLTLINGDRISMPPMVRLLFEVADLAQASPATVSRAGMVSWQRDFHGFPTRRWESSMGILLGVSLSHFPGVSKSKKFGPMGFLTLQKVGAVWGEQNGNNL